MAHNETATAYLTPEEYVLLKRLSKDERRSISGTIALLILQEAARRGMIGRAPQSELPKPEVASNIVSVVKPQK